MTMENNEAVVHCALNALSSQIDALKELVNSLASMQEIDPELFRLAEERRESGGFGNPLSMMAEELGHFLGQIKQYVYVSMSEKIGQGF